MVVKINIIESTSKFTLNRFIFFGFQNKTINKHESCRSLKGNLLICIDYMIGGQANLSHRVTKGNLKITILCYVVSI